MLGHSMGEYAAACLAGVFSLRDVLAVVACRGRLFETLPAGAMLSVPLPEAEVLPELLPGLSFAASNGPGLCLVSGEVAAIAELESRLAAKGVETRRLAITVAAHSQMVDPILGEFEAYLRSLTLSEPTLPFISNVTGTWITPAEARDPRYWVRHLRQPVRFAEGVSTLVSQPGYALVEIGPGRTLTSLAQAHPAIGSARAVVQSLRHPHDPTTDRHAVLSAVGRLWAVGVEPNWKAVFGDGRRRVSLPTYSFDHERHWIEPGNGFFLRAQPVRAIEKNADRSQWTYRPAWRQTERPRATLDGARNILVFEDETGVGSRARARPACGGSSRDVGRAPDRSFARLNDSTFQVRTGSREDHAALLRELSSAGRTPAQIVHMLVRRCRTRHRGSRVAPSGTSSRSSRSAQALVDEEPPGSARPRRHHQWCRSCRWRHGARVPVESPDPGSAAGRAARNAVHRVPVGRSGERDRIRRGQPHEHWSRRSRRRRTPRVSRSAVTIASSRPTSAGRLPTATGSWPLRQRGVVLMTGGLGGIALALAERLARSAQARFVLVGRTALPDRCRMGAAGSHTR